ncbi:MAG: hypothetical protein HYY40_08735 [Bacteroidetes bacterium]|nr:hypothetical protein [Bacteroidota bacterium]
MKSIANNLDFVFSIRNFGNPCLPDRQAKFAILLFVLLLFFTAIFTNCTNDRNVGKDKKTGYDNQPAETMDNLEKGKVTDTVHLFSDQEISYALFLPSRYDKGRKWPVIFFFDPHAKGSYPLIKYSDMAEKYGYILAGSNTIRNGMPMSAVEEHAVMLMADVSERVSVNGRRVYLAGFSGGARVAAYIAMKYDYISCVIGCGAGSHEIMNITRPGFSYLAFAGNEDFNFIELKKLNSALDNLPARHYLFEFTGKHEWPAEAIFETTFIWTELDAMRKQVIPVDDSLVRDCGKTFAEEIDSLEMAKDLLKTEDACRRYITFLEGFTNIEKSRIKIETMETNGKLENLKKSENELLNQESRQQEVYLQHLQNKDIRWWENESRRLISLSTDSKSPSSLSVKRLLGYLSLACYMYSANFLNKNDLATAEHFIIVYKLLDPHNPEHNYLLASVNARRGILEKVLSELKNAVKLGFDDYGRMEKDSNFVSYRQTPEFRKILSDIIKPE